MKPHEAGTFIRSLHKTPEERLNHAVLTGKFPKRHLNEKERMLAHRRIRDINEELLPEVLESLAEVEGERDRFFATQALRNRSEKKLHRDFQDRLKKARALPKRLEKERKTLEKMIKESLMAEELALQEEGQRKAARFNAKALSVVDSIGEKPDAVRLVFELAESLDGSIETAFGHILKGRFTYEDLEVEKRHIEETHNITVDPLPKCPDLSYADDLRTAVKKLLGRPLEIKRNMNWKRIWAQQRASDRDAAAVRLGLKD